MDKVKVLIKDGLFDSAGLKADQVCAYTFENDDYIRIFGSVTCDTNWDEKYNLRIKANVCDEENQIVGTGYDYDQKRFINTNYDSFSICVNTMGAEAVIDHAEIYPVLVPAGNKENF